MHASKHYHYDSYVTSSSAISWSTNSNSADTVTNASLNFEPSGLPIMIGLISYASGAPGYIGVRNQSGASYADGVIQLDRPLFTAIDAQRLTTQATPASGPSLWLRQPCSSVFFIDRPPEGTQVNYVLRAYTDTINTYISIVNCYLFAMEIGGSHYRELI